MLYCFSRFRVTAAYVTVISTGKVSGRAFLVETPLLALPVEASAIWMVLLQRIESSMNGRNSRKGLMFEILRNRITFLGILKYQSGTIMSVGCV